MAQFRITRSDGSETLVDAQLMARVGNDLLFREPRGTSWRTVAAAPVTDVVGVSTLVTQYVAAERWASVSIPTPAPGDVRPSAFG